ncbi:hypothetical protein F5Y03DRAFT_400512 [Xylaria venustula]|nr:hypothetical protein F5Y03DRAFT_400512 [Xylaria venustula]
MDAHTKYSDAATILCDEYRSFDEYSEIGSEPSFETFSVKLELEALYECWTVAYHKRIYKPYTGLRFLGVPLFELMELRDSYIVSVRKDLQSSQAHLASTYESERRGRCYAQKLACRMWTLPWKVQDVIYNLLGRENRQWSVVVLSRARGTETADPTPGFRRHVKQYQLVLCSKLDQGFTRHSLTSQPPPNTTPYK